MGCARATLADTNFCGTASCLPSSGASGSTPSGTEVGESKIAAALRGGKEEQIPNPETFRSKSDSSGRQIFKQASLVLVFLVFLGLPDLLLPCHETQSFLAFNGRLISFDSPLSCLTACKN